MDAVIEPAEDERGMARDWPAYRACCCLPQACDDTGDAGDVCHACPVCHSGEWFAAPHPVREYEPEIDSDARRCEIETGLYRQEDAGWFRDDFPPADIAE